MRVLDTVYLARLSGACTLHAGGLLPSEVRPLLMSVWITGECHSRCVMCTSWNNVPGPVISLERIDRLLAEAEALGIQGVRFSGGEPALRPDLGNIVMALNARSFRKAVLATNGLLLEPHLDAINRSALTQLTVSLDGMREAHDTIRGVAGSFERLMPILPRIQKKIKIATLLTKHLAPCLDELLRFCKERGYEIDFAVPHRNGPPFFDSAQVNAAVEAMMPSDEQREQMFRTLEKHGVMTAPLVAASRRLMVDRALDFDHCINPYTTVIIYWNGDVRAGCFAFEPVGNINDSALSDVLAGTSHARDTGRAFRMDCPRNCAGSDQSTAAASPFSSLGYALRRMH